MFFLMALVLRVAEAKPLAKSAKEIRDNSAVSSLSVWGKTAQCLGEVIYVIDV